MRILSGVQPSGKLHLGNYFGMMLPMLEYQRAHELYCMVVNYHALTSNQDGKLLKSQTLEAVVDFLALGLDPSKTILWVQSDVPEVTELTWILSNVTGMGLLERCHSYKDKIANGLKPTHGLFAYPVLMAADILIMQAERIPVGRDQKQHVEVARDIAEKFNRVYGEVFKIPVPEIRHGGKMLLGTDGRKMSKAYNNVIEIFTERDVLTKRIMSLKTDSKPPEAPKDIETNGLFMLMAAFLDSKGRQALENRFLSPGLRYKDLKEELVEKIWSHFSKERQLRGELVKDPQYVLDVLRAGAEKARSKASTTMRTVREKIGITYQ